MCSIWYTSSFPRSNAPSLSWELRTMTTCSRSDAVAAGSGAVSTRFVSATRPSYTRQYARTWTALRCTAAALRALRTDASETDLLLESRCARCRFPRARYVSTCSQRFRISFSGGSSCRRRFQRSAA